jgi:hypothetical protein
MVPMITDVELFGRTKLDYCGWVRNCEAYSPVLAGSISVHRYQTKMNTRVDLDSKIIRLAHNRSKSYRSSPYTSGRMG